jgi:hypothetical protein
MKPPNCVVHGMGSELPTGTSFGTAISAVPPPHSRQGQDPRRRRWGIKAVDLMCRSEPTSRSVFVDRGMPSVPRRARELVSSKASANIARPHAVRLRFARPLREL